jgi:hypothetical protein
MSKGDYSPIADDAHHGVGNPLWGMRGAPHVPYGELSARARRRLALGALLRSLGVSAVVVLGYFVLPVTTKPDLLALVVLVVGLVVVAVLLTWQIRGITRSPYPRIKGVETLATTVPVFFVVFATTYYLMGQAAPASFTEKMNRLDSMYFTVTTFATVGYGDIAPVSEAARLIAIVQMIGDLAIVGLVARLLFNAVQIGISRRDSDDAR